MTGAFWLCQDLTCSALHFDRWRSFQTLSGDFLRFLAIVSRTTEKRNSNRTPLCRIVNVKSSILQFQLLEIRLVCSILNLKRLIHWWCGVFRTRKKFQEWWNLKYGGPHDVICMSATFWLFVATKQKCSFCCYFSQHFYKNLKYPAAVYQNRPKFRRGSKNFDRNFCRRRATTYVAKNCCYMMATLRFENYQVPTTLWYYQRSPQAPLRL